MDATSERRLLRFQAGLQSPSESRQPAFAQVLGADGVTLDAARLIHRTPANDKAFITFHLVQNGVFLNVTSWPVHDLNALLPFVEEHLAENAYHSVNSMFRAGLEWETARDGHRIHHRIFAPGLLPTYRANKGVRYLNCAYVDVDCHAAGRTPGEVLGIAWDMQLAGAIPDVSLFQLSGRGLWLMWLLREEEADGPLPDSPRAWPERADLYRRLEKAIAQHFLPLGGDLNATDIARITRLAGSVNTKAGKRVRVLPQLVNGKIPFYTLKELAAFWKVEAPAPIQQALTVRPVAARPAARPQARPVRDANRPRDPKKQAAARARWKYALLEFETLRDLRGGRFPENTRQNACFALALLLRRNQVGPDLLAAAVHQLAERSGLPRHEAQHAIYQSSKYATSNPSGRYFADLLHVTPEEAALLARWPAAGTQPPAPSVMAAARTTDERRTVMLRLIAERGVAPSVRVMTAQLTAAGFPVSIATVGADYQKLNICSGHPAGRPPRLPLA